MESGKEETGRLMNIIGDLVGILGWVTVVRFVKLPFHLLIVIELGISFDDIKSNCLFEVVHQLIATLR